MKLLTINLGTFLIFIYNALGKKSIISLILLYL